MVMKEETFKCQKYAISVARDRSPVTASATLTIKPRNGGTPIFKVSIASGTVKTSKSRHAPAASNPALS